MPQNMKLSKEDWPDYFGPLFPYVNDDNVTDIDISADLCYITDASGRRWRDAETDLPEGFLDRFVQRVANTVSLPFNKETPVLEAETHTLRIPIFPASVAVSGTCVSIGKSLPSVLRTEENMLESGYCSREILELLKACVRQGKNLVFCGEPGAGKTECAKFFSTFIPPEQRVITIEDNPEWHYGSICPGHDSVELVVGRSVDYTKAIKTCLRLNPAWMMLSEARSVEVLKLIEGFSTGVHGMTTIHTDSVEKIPDRMVNMAGSLPSEERFLNNIYSFIDVGVLIRRREERDESGQYRTVRSIDQIGFFTREGGKNVLSMVVVDGQMVERDAADAGKLADRTSVEGLLAGESSPGRLLAEEDPAGKRLQQTEEDVDSFTFASDRIAISAEGIDDGDERRKQERMDEIMNELIRLGRNGRTCLGRTQVVG